MSSSAPRKSRSRKTTTQPAPAKPVAVKPEVAQPVAPVAKPTVARAKAAPKAAVKPVEVEVAIRAEEDEATLNDLIAFHAFLMWEHGVPGSMADHWFAAEQAVRTA